MTFPTEVDGSAKHQQEARAIRDRYARRESQDLDAVYSWIRPDVSQRCLELDHALARLLPSCGVTSYLEASVFEVGCGTGDNLLRFLRWGVRSEALHGCDLLGERVMRARARLPGQADIRCGDFLDLDLYGARYSIVAQFTVLSSILDDGMRAAVSKRMWELLAPGGVLISYDFTYSNPRNPDVRGVTAAEMKHLFPAGRRITRQLTLMPPLARRLNFCPPLINALSRMRIANTHRLELIVKN